MSKKSLKILVDEQLDGLDEKLIQNGYDAANSAKKLFAGKSDYTILKHVEKHKMVFITQDKENIKACSENNIRCVPINKDQTLEIALNKLSKF